MQDLGTDAPVVLAINKVDRQRDKSRVLPLIAALTRVRAFAAVVPISALRGDNEDRLLDEITALLPAGPWQFGSDEITDRPMRFFAAEYIREQILLATQAEVPHACAVSIDTFIEPAGRGAVHIDATIHVERQGQKKILIGAGASVLKRIGTQARLRIDFPADVRDPPLATVRLRSSFRPIECD